MLGKSSISSANKQQNHEIEEETLKVDWPEDSVERAKLIRTRAQSMTENMESIFNGFIMGIISSTITYSLSPASSFSELCDIGSSLS